ncbi:MAG TPA: COR domain-containing protein [Chroococcidiopsis sp.]
MNRAELLKIINQAVHDQVTTLDLSSCNLTVLPSEIGQLTRLTSLNLSNNQLTKSSLPEAIGQLRQLTALQLVGNQLNDLPEAIAHLHSLQELDLSYNRLKTIPTAVTLLPSLTSLVLRSNEISDIPMAIAQMQSLAVLDLSSNQIGQIPSAIAQLQQLTVLDLTSNQISEVPIAIAQLQQLETLYLDGNKISRFPAAIALLTNLLDLYLSFNEISEIPVSIAQLKKLTCLYISDNKISKISPAIAQLKDLKTLDLSGNQISAIPEEITQLESLNTLNLSDNQISEIPISIAQLERLAELNLSVNQIREIPALIVQPHGDRYIPLKNLTQFNLANNPLESPPPEVASQGIESIRDYFCQIDREGVDYLYEAKLLILGEGGAGKTTLSRKIQSPDYQLKDEDSTRGIEVSQWQFLMDNGRPFQVNVWDFGGQEIYHATHQFFLTRRSLYVLVADNRKEDTDFYYWLNVVELLSDNSPLLIIKNEKQDRQREINERQFRGRFDNLKATLASNLATNRGLPEVLREIKHYISTLPHIGSTLPKTWVSVRRALEADSRPTISLEHYLDLCQQHGFSQRQDKLQLSSYLHDLGVLLHFQDDPLLKKTVILKPRWGTDAVYRVFDNTRVINNQGRFNRDDLATIWSDDAYVDFQDELLQLMCRFKLCYAIPGQAGHYIAPQLLSENQPDYDWDDANNLILRYTYAFMPKGVLTRFIVATHSWLEQQAIVWKSGVVLSRDQTCAEVVEHYDKREIKIRVSGQHKRDLMTVITYELDKIHASYPRLKCSKLIPCNCLVCKDSQTPHFYEYDKLRERISHRKETVECGNPPYHEAKVLSLLDDVLNAEPLRSPSRARTESDRPLTLANAPAAHGAPAKAAAASALTAETLARPQTIAMTETAPITPSPSPAPEVFVSYAWGGESEQIVNQLDRAFQQRGITLIRDKRDLGFKGRIKDFMQQIGRGKAVVAVISEKYLKSENCMYELVQIAENGAFYDRIFPIVLSDANIYKPVQRIRYIKYWEDQIAELDEAIKSVGAANLQGIRDDIDSYTQIRATIAELTNILKDMNTLTPEMHTESEFEEIFEAIATKLAAENYDRDSSQHPHH